MREDTERMQYGELSSLVALAHELKSPLGLIRQMSMAHSYYDDAQREKAFARIELISERSLRLVEALTRSERIDQFHTETVNLNRVCEEVLHEFSPLLKELACNMTLVLPRQPVLAVGNQEVLRSVVVGLCDNALSYGNTDQPIEVKVSRRGAEARMSVKDYGPAIEKKHLETLKNRLGNAPQPLAQRPQSSGLGLYIAGQFAEAMQGTIGLSRHRFGGNSFYIQVPCSTQLGLFAV